MHVRVKGALPREVPLPGQIEVTASYCGEKYLHIFFYWIENVKGFLVERNSR